ncbi:glycosyltransferase family 4 protein [Mucilaginibacter paludis]|uniref:Glycosyl transferase group 1 n=1 Tax=Mucilaginibacter paludis DSM 18603 TaxID=714943 RepID=H1Y0J2_9SPHI|nr:glycosyltransferase family 4 protein [Mucilaginibacter paludis]EHQ28459.1 glycosyl transferase group 1 [Mucilaginibacter paludis DSM 18603]
MKLLVFDSHPVQYRVPIWKEIDSLKPESLHVVYASDCSVKGYADKEFSESFAWDIPMLSGYRYTILNTENGEPLSGWNSLGGKGVRGAIKKFKPDALMLTGLNYRFDWVVFFYAQILRIPIWLRCETQDYAFKRSKLVSLYRYLVYFLFYKGIDRFFFIGELNKEHYLNHGVKASKLLPARYATVNQYLGVDEDEKKQIQSEMRTAAGIDPDKLVIGFSGKFIEKKNPQLLFLMLEYLPAHLLSKIHLYLLGSGQLESELKDMASVAFNKYGVKTTFTGFVNQSKIGDHYLAMDVVVLPSRQSGETWGLVANEGMQAGCGVIVSNVVGCQADFGKWERFKVFKQGDEKDLASCVTQLAVNPKKFDWAASELQESYSISAIAKTIVSEMSKF